MDTLLALLHQTPDENWEWQLDTSTEWSVKNALSLANCALLAYNDPSVIDRHLAVRGFSNVFHMQSKTFKVDTQAFVAVRDDAVVVAFRGTEPTNPIDFFTDFMTTRVAFEDKFNFPGWGYIWEGWANGLLAVWPQLLEKLKDYDNRPLWITGHSLGGALATVMAAVLANLSDHPIRGVYTYGQPRVGDPTFCNRYNQALANRTFRHVNNYDLVPHVPPRRFTRVEQKMLNAEGVFSKVADLFDTIKHSDEIYEYDHVGQLRLLLPDGGCVDDLAKEIEREPAFLKEERTDPFAIVNFSRLVLEVAARIKDHAPINPITHDGYIERLENVV